MYVDYAEGMDVQRQTSKLHTVLRRGALLMALLAAAGTVTIILARLKDAAPPIDRRSVLIGKVRRGPMVRNVRGIGELVPEEVLWVPAVTEGRVGRIRVRPGAAVTSTTILLEMDNPDLKMEAMNAQWQVKSAQAELTAGRVKNENAILEMSAATAVLDSEFRALEMKTKAYEQLYRTAAVSGLELKNMKLELEAKSKSLQAGIQRQAKARESARADQAVMEAALEQARALYQLKRSQLEALHIRAGVNGVLEQYTEDVAVGKRVQASAPLAKVIDPRKLMGVLRVAETQARELQLGLSVNVEMLGAARPGRITRIDPAVIEGNVKVDVSFSEGLPQGARPDLSIIGTVELERLADAVVVERPVTAVTDVDSTIFKLVERGREALRVPVRFGRSSVNEIEVLKGLVPGDEVIVSDMSRWDNVNRLQIQ